MKYVVYEINGAKVLIDWDAREMFGLTPMADADDAETSSLNKEPPRYGTGKRSCGICGKVGHTRTTCATSRTPQSDVENDEEEVDDATQGKIKKLADEGMNSTQIAAALKLPLEVVNKYW